MWASYLQVAIGGAIGSCLRFGVGRVLMPVQWAGFPLGVVTVNVVGSFLIGVVMVISFQKGLQPFNPLVMSGVLGGFTTFSAFSLESFTLWERGEFGLAIAYVATTLVLSLGGIVLGVGLARALLP